jgi:hypothetical protein
MKAQFRSELNNLPTTLLHSTVKLLHRWQRVQNLFTFICRYANGALGNHRWFRTQFIVRSFNTDKDYSHGYHRSLNVQNWSRNSTMGLNGNKSKEKSTFIITFAVLCLASAFSLCSWIKKCSSSYSSLYCQLGCLFHIAIWYPWYACI